MSRIILKKVPFAQVPAPPTGKVALYVDSADNIAYAVFENGSRTPLGGGGSGSGLNFYPNISSFPPTGTTNEFYIDTTSGQIYIWNSTTSSYQPTSSNAYVRNLPSTRFSDAVTVTTISDALDLILFPYAPPLVALSSVPVPQYRERGVPVSSVSLAASVTKKKNNITSIRYLKNGSQIFLNSSPPTGTAVSTYNYTTPFSVDSQYQVEVNDGTTIVQSNILDFKFVYPVYVGVGAIGLSNSQIQALTKLILEPMADLPRSLSPTSQVMYFACPSAYDGLTAILDPHSNNTLVDWTIRLANFTMADGNSVQYRIYEFNNLTTQSGFITTFKFK